jgi:hypothetical protein
MKTGRKLIILLLIILGQGYLCAQVDPKLISRIEDNKIFIDLDLRWDKQQKKELQKLFSIDSTVWQKIGPGAVHIELDSTRWEVRHISSNIVEISRQLEDKAVSHFDINDVFLLDDSWQVNPGYVDMEKVSFGSNRLKKGLLFNYNSGTARFYLPGYPDTKKAYIAGSFNNWDPTGKLMQKTDSGWIADVKLITGKYLYKFILDGNWIKDPNNENSENDGAGHINSVIFCPNYVFRLNGHKDARRVVLSGSFNDWNERALRMYPDAGGWNLPVYIKEGTWTYKFVVDDEWMTDPANPKTRNDGRGNENSVLGIGDSYTFRLNGFFTAGEVFLSGNFNSWNPKEIKMYKANGGWQIDYQLAPGNYEYKFLVDDIWTTDPSNPFTIGTGEYTNSCLALNANYTFAIAGFQDAKEIRLTGDFNGWSKEGYRMAKENGVWKYPIYLPKGKHLYKVIIDREWMLDPTNKLWEENEYGTGNSILWVR